MTQGDATEKLRLRDERGHLYVLTPELPRAMRVPDHRRAEGEAAVGGHLADAGLIDIDTLGTQPGPRPRRCP